MVGNLGECGKAAVVAFNGDDPLGAIHEQRPGQAARTRPDLDHRRLGKIAGRSCHLAGEVQVEQEILPERLLRLEPVALDDLAKRGKSVEAHFGRASLSASCRASLSAAIRLSGRATPFPAMLKAVPWSGEVRIKGRPSVTFTVSSNASVLAGISA